MFVFSSVARLRGPNLCVDDREDQPREPVLAFHGRTLYHTFPRTRGPTMAEKETTDNVRCACWPCVLVREKARQEKKKDSSSHDQPIEMMCASYIDKKFAKIPRTFFASELLPLARAAVKAWFEPKRPLRERLMGL